MSYFIANIMYGNLEYVSYQDLLYTIYSYGERIHYIPFDVLKYLKRKKLS